jgi:uncharacterized RDD family membrane protein YckC
MNCQNCEAPVPADADHCEKCGAKLLSRRVIFGAPRREEFTLTAEEEPIDLDQPAEEEAWRFPAQSEKAAPGMQPAREAVVDFAYGGFLRRLGAFGVDLATILLLCALMGAMAYVGYKVGLTAHGRFVSLENAMPLVVLLTFGWFLLTTAYFVLFHGLEGKTVGKWLFGLRVVGEERQPISYRRALLRWIAWLGFGCTSLGLSFLWILWNREKRAWHDFLARTWVVRE